jgi:V-type H+-transporting ATPase subunit a
MMGFFAFYNGIIYNDFVSLSLNLFGSCYQLKETPNPIDPKSPIKFWLPIENCLYPFGIDPVWSASANSLTFLNSYKMKLAVIIGVLHMSFGILLKGANSIYFKNWIDFWCEFVPQILFMMCTFGLMDLMIIYKWTHVYDPAHAPSIITLLIGLVLSPFDYPDPPLWEGSELIINQVCVAIAFVCVPMMLIPKPYLLRAQYEKQH